MATVLENCTIISDRLLRALGMAILEKVGVPQADAEITVDSLVEADLCGVHSHGSTRLIWYTERLRMGGDNPRPNIRVVEDSPAVAVIDGDRGLGQVVSRFAMKKAIAKAQSAGVGIVGVRNSHHFGACAYWAQMALAHDMIGLVLTNGGPLMAPWGGITRSLSNDPIGMAIPAGKELPIVLDMATTIVAGGKLDLAAQRNETIPLGWALNGDGLPTTDAMEARTGLLLPIGGYKGYGLTLMFEVLAAVLTGANFARDVPAPQQTTTAMNIGHYFQAINVSAFMPIAMFKTRVDGLIRQMKSSQLAPGVERICVPGELEQETRAKYVVDGIPMPSEVVKNLYHLASQLGLSVRQLAMEC